MSAKVKDYVLLGGRGLTIKFAEYMMAECNRIVGYDPYEEMDSSTIMD